MRNEEKAREIAKEAANPTITLENRNNIEYSVEGKCRDSALEMAEWKDQQFKECLETQREYYYRRCKVNDIGTLNKIECINEIIKKLFGED